MSKVRKFVASRAMSFKSAGPDGELEVITLEPGDTLVVQPETHDVENAPADVDVLEMAPEATPPAPIVEPEAVPALSSRRRFVRPALASAASQSIRQRVQDFRASALKGSVLR